MGMRTLTATLVTLPVTGRWTIGVETSDDDGILVSAAPSIVVTLPGGTTANPTFDEDTTGRYFAYYEPATTGRYVARVTATGYGAADFAAYVEAVTAGTGMPVVSDVDTYLGDHSWATDDMQDALDAEAAAQRAVCRVGAVYPADLREALLRRVQRNLNMRRLPLAVLRGDAEAGDMLLPGRDPEVRRLEAPHRRLVVG